MSFKKLAYTIYFLLNASAMQCKMDIIKISERSSGNSRAYFPQLTFHTLLKFCKSYEIVSLERLQYSRRIIARNWLRLRNGNAKKSYLNNWNLHY